MTRTDTELVAKARQGDRSAFARLLEGHYEMIYRVAYRFTGYAEDAEDVAQDVCLMLVDKLASFRGDSDFSTWLYRMVVNACKDMHKKRKTHRSLEGSYLGMEQQRQADDRDTARRAASLYRAIALLEPSLKETALLVLAEGLSHAQAGEVLGCAESTISWRLHEIRKKLKVTMDGGHADG